MQWVGNYINDGLRSHLTCSGVNAAQEEAPNDHPDHLGSSSFITDAIGYATQHLQYLPFGETFVDQKAGSFDSRYKFSAKEKDDETGYSYFGARYYDSDLSVFLSIDRYADKYPSLSAYNYCGWNPVKNIDINGDSIRVRYGGFLFFGRKEATYRDGKFYNKSGSEISRNNKFFNTVKDAVNIITSESNGNSGVTELANGDNDLIIQRYYGGANYSAFTPSNFEKSFNGEGSGGRIALSLKQTIDPLFVVVAHEMGHALSSQRGDASITNWGYVGHISFSTDEKFAMHFENLIRAEHHMPLRMFYDPMTKAGQAVKGFDESLNQKGVNYFGGRMIYPININQILKL